MIEGLREIRVALSSGWKMQSLLVLESLLEDESLAETLADYGTQVESLISIDAKVYEKLAHRKTTEGVLAICHTDPRTLAGLTLGSNPLVLVAEAPEKPGNIGALLRTADAAGLDAVLIANPRTDLFNPNVIRSSLGCVFSVPVAQASGAEIKAFLKEQGIKIYSAALHPESQPYLESDYRGASAIAVGTEDQGLTQEWLEADCEKIAIEMRGKIDSMNVSVSAAILIFEARRQRGSSA